MAATIIPCTQSNFTVRVHHDLFMYLIFYSQNKNKIYVFIIPHNILNVFDFNLLRILKVGRNCLFCFYLAGPDPCDQIPVVLEYVEYFQDSSGVAENRDAGIRDGEI